MLANEAEFEVLLARYDDDPGICSKILRTHALTDPKIFLGYAESALSNRPVSRALKFIAGLALSAGIMDRLLQLYVKDRPRCMSLARKLMACDMRFDVTFLEFLQRPHPGEAEENIFHIGLDILDLISQGDRLVPGVLKVLKHPNPKVRSKAALFIGSRTQNLAWAANRTQDYDARVRANIVESLYGINSDFVHQIFRNNVADENNRVAGNAILGLYLLGDPASIPLIYDLARHPDARFRNTCAWIMGRTGDPRFAQSFSELMNDPDELVRAQAFKGLGEVRKALRAKRVELRSRIVSVAPGLLPSATVIVHDGSGQPVRNILPTSFVLKSDAPAKPVRCFSVDEYDCRNSLNVAFLLCLPQQDEAAVDARFVQAIQSCQSLRRSKDRWSVVRISPKLRKPPPVPASGEPAWRPRHKWSILKVDFDEEAAVVDGSTSGPVGPDYSGSQLRIDAMLREPAVMLGEDSGDEAAQILLSALLHVDIASSKPQWIVFGAGPHTQILEALQAKGPDLEACVHVLAQAGPWRSSEVKTFAGQTGGTYHVIDDITSASEVCSDIYSALLHHYQIGWKDASAEGVELDIYCDAGRASTAYEMPETRANTLIA